MKRLSLIWCAGLFGCATIIHGSRQSVGITSVPTAAQVVVDNVPECQTPCFGNLTRYQNHIIAVKKAGYETYNAMITKSASPWIWANAVFFFLPGLIVDAISGGMWELDPDKIYAPLQKRTPGPTEEPQ